MNRVATVDLAYGFALMLIVVAMVAGAILTLYEDGDDLSGTVVVACALYLALLGAWHIRRGMRKR